VRVGAAVGGVGEGAMEVGGALGVRDLESMEDWWPDFGSQGWSASSVLASEGRR